MVLTKENTMSEPLFVLVPVLDEETKDFYGCDLLIQRRGSADYVGGVTCGYNVYTDFMVEFRSGPETSEVFDNLTEACKYIQSALEEVEASDA